MEKEFLKLFNVFESHIDIGMSKDIQVFLEGNTEVKKYDMHIGDKEMLILDIILYEFSKHSSKIFFLDFVEFVGYTGVNMFITECLKNEIRYLYLTTKDGVGGTKMKITLR